jgi:osmotically-inducible protein OsmY
MSNNHLRETILAELEFDPAVDASSLTVEVIDGIARLGGRTGSATEKAAASAAVRRLKAVRGIADEIQIAKPGAQAVSDTDLAKQAAGIIDFYVRPEPGTVCVSAENGWITLFGNVDSFFEGREIESAVRNLDGVRGLTNKINKREDPSSEEVRAKITAVFERDLFEEPVAMKVSAFGGKATLEGAVRNMTERDLAGRAAGSVDGITFVENLLTVSETTVRDCA